MAPTTTTSAPSTGRGGDGRRARGSGSFARPQVEVGNRNTDDEDGEGEREGYGADAHETCAGCHPERERGAWGRGRRSEAAVVAPHTHPGPSLTLGVTGYCHPPPSRERAERAEQQPAGDEDPVE